MGSVLTLSSAASASAKPRQPSHVRSQQLAAAWGTAGSDARAAVEAMSDEGETMKRDGEEVESKPYILVQLRLVRFVRLKCAKHHKRSARE